MQGNVEIKENYFYISSFRDIKPLGKKIKLNGRDELKPSNVPPDPSKASIFLYATVLDEEVFEFKDLKIAQESITEEMRKKQYRVFVAKRDLSGMFLEEV